MVGLYGLYGMGGSISASGRERSVAAAGLPQGAVSGAQNPAVSQPIPPVTAAPSASREEPGSTTLTGAAAAPCYREGGDPAALAVQGRIQYLSPEEVDKEIEKAKSAQEVMEEGECQTCKERKYQDGSNDPGVSFKTPTNVAPELAASAVRGHEQEHVVREQAQARREGREVVSQSVTYHTAICPECGRVYVSGGTTRTSTRAVSEQLTPDAAQAAFGGFSAVA